MAVFNADLSQYQAQHDYSPIPPGEYRVEVIDSEVRESKAGNLMARYTFEVMDPPYAGRRVWDQFVLGNQIGMQRLKTLATCAGHTNPNFIRDTDELHGRCLVIRVKIDEQEGYEPRNSITRFKPLPQTAAAPAAPAAPVPPVQQTAQKAQKYPWQQKA